MEIQLEIEREETRRRERDGGMDEDLAGLHQVMKKVGKKREERPLLQEELSDNDLEGLTALEIDYDEAIVQEVNKGIEDITRDLSDINQINTDLGQVAANAGHTLQTIEDKMEESQLNTDIAVKELGEARKIQSSTRTTKAVLGSAGSCALAGAVAGAVLGPPGSATLFVAGAVVGGVVGGLGGAGLGYGVGKALDQTRDVEWEEIDGFNAKFMVGFDKVERCMECAKEFGVIRGKKHCLVCGGVFCGGCLKKRKVVYEEIEKEVKGRVCGQCREAHPGERFQAGEESPILKMLAKK